VDYATARVTYATLAQAGGRGIYLGAAATSEEKLPAGYNFDTSLGRANPAVYPLTSPLNITFVNYGGNQTFYP
jgi:hypothetical protein